MASTDATLTVKLDSGEAVRRLEEVLKKFDIVKKSKELDFAVGALEREVNKLLLRVAELEDKVKDLAGWQEDKDRVGCEE